MDADVLIVGAGLAGLSCAGYLHDHGVSCLILERSDGIGGRVRTDKVEGFLLDRGFQVLLTAYPAAQHLLDYDALNLKRFYNGSLIWKDGRFHRVADPLRHPAHAFATLRAPIGSLADKVRMLPLRRTLLATDHDSLFEREEITTLEALQNRWGFSETIIDGFFRPFIGGVTLDRSLQTSSRSFEFVMQMFAAGDAAVPAQGMQAIPDQLAALLPAETLRLNTPARLAKAGHGVSLTDGSRLQSKALVIATEGPEAHSLTGALAMPDSQSVACLYFAAENAPIDEPILMLNGEPDALVNNISVMSAVAPSYAPAGAALLSATVLGSPSMDEEALVEAVRAEMGTLFGAQVQRWKHLRTYRIWHALPAQPPPALTPPHRPTTFEPGFFICGDHRDHASIHGAMASGIRTAQAVLNDLH